MLGEQMWRSKTLKDLGMSSTKFNSVARPLARLAFSFHATMKMMQNVWELRGGSIEEAIAAHEFAQWLEIQHAVLFGFSWQMQTQKE